MIHHTSLGLFLQHDGGTVKIRTTADDAGGDLHLTLRHEGKSGSATLTFYGQPLDVAAVIDLLAAAAQKHVPGYADACEALLLDPEAELSRFERVMVWDEVERLRTALAAEAITDEAIAGTADALLALSGDELMREHGIETSDPVAADAEASGIGVQA